jgi:hypothetical protein
VGQAGLTAWIRSTVAGLQPFGFDDLESGGLHQG